MTTGRINQVTILPSGAEAREETPHEAGQNSSLRRRDTPRPRALSVTSTATRPGARLHRFTTAIQLPPLSSPRDGPSHQTRPPEGVAKM